MEKVYVEIAWYDGPRNGIADFNGVPHRFVFRFEDLSSHFDTFNIFPISIEELELEIEQWNIFVDWNRKYEVGDVDTESHPGHGRINGRWDEIEEKLKTVRDVIPENALLATAVFPKIDQENRYEPTGPDYGVVWTILNDKS